jgi:hypothetical protein
MGHGKRAGQVRHLRLGSRIEQVEAVAIQAIAAQLATGASLPDAVARAKAYLTQALRSATQLDVGHGHGPVNHMWPLLNAE